MSSTCSCPSSASTLSSPRRNDEVSNLSPLGNGAASPGEPDALPMNDDSDTLRRLAESQYNQEFDKAADFIAACAAATALSQFGGSPWRFPRKARSRGDPRDGRPHSRQGAFRIVRSASHLVGKQSPAVALTASFSRSAKASSSIRQPLPKARCCGAGKGNAQICQIGVFGRCRSLQDVNGTFTLDERARDTITALIR